MCCDNAYIYFSDLVPSQNSFVVTEKPLACSQGMSKYADYPLQSCMPWFINPWKQFENTQLKKKKRQTIFSYYNFSKFSDGNAVWKRERTVLKASPLASFFAGNEEWCLYWHRCDETDLCWEIPKGTQLTWSVMPVRASPQLLLNEFWVGAGLIHLKRYAAQKYRFCFQDSESSSLQHQPLSHCYTKLALLFEPIPEPVICYVAAKQYGACHCTKDVGRVRLVLCPRTHPWAYPALLLVL